VTEAETGGLGVPSNRNPHLPFIYLNQAQSLATRHMR
ncbi:MAG: hypothetical protein RIQ75_1496, partial [Pseudomonadota bacterium]